MQTIRQNIDDWLRREAHVVAGHPFQMSGCSCVPVAPQTNNEGEKMPIGFLVTHGADMAFVAVQTPDGEQIMAAWTKSHLQEIVEENHPLPAECWYG